MIGNYFIIAMIVYVVAGFIELRSYIVHKIDKFRMFRIISISLLWLPSLILFIIALIVVIFQDITDKRRR